MSKFIYAFVSCFILIFCMSSFSFAYDNGVDVKKFKGTELIDFAKKNNIPLKSEKGTLNEIVIIKNANIPNANIPNANLKSLLPNKIPNVQIFDDYYLKQTDSGDACGTQIISTHSARGPGTLRSDVSQNISNSYSTTVSISASVFSSSLGYDVTKGRNVTGSYTITIPDGKYGTIDARTYYHCIYFDIWESHIIGSDTKVGNGYLMLPVGVCFSSYLS